MMNDDFLTGTLFNLRQWPLVWVFPIIRARMFNGSTEGLIQGNFSRALDEALADTYTHWT